MGTLLHIGSDSTHLLAAHTVIGRAPGCQIRVEDPEVSATHASVSWVGERWVLRDLGSRNGTSVDGQSLDAGQSQALTEGALVELGGKASGWRVVDAGAPVAHARTADRVVLPTDVLLLLPDPDEPEHVLFFDPDAGWVQFDGEHRVPVEDGAVVICGGHSWTLALPVPLEETCQPDQVLPDRSEVAVSFTVSSDEEHVVVRLTGPHGFEVELPSRSYHYMLLTLARERLADAERGRTEPERGWVHRDELAKMLRVGTRTLTVHLCRAHKQVGDAGVMGAADLFEHRPGTRQVRLNLDVAGIDTLG